VKVFVETSANIRQDFGTGDKDVLAFGEFVLDRGRKTLLRAGVPVALKPKVYDLLCLLIDHQDRVVSNAEIMDALWPRQDIDESNLGKMVYELRQALGDGALVQNLPRRGYRFAGEISLPPLEPIDSVATRADEPASPPTSLASRRRLVVPLALVGIALMTVLMIWLGPLNDPTTPEAAPVFSFSPTRIAVLPFKDFSPEGDQQFLGDGLADTLLRAFTGVEELSVIARASAFAYRGRDIATVARDLEVGSVLDGSVQRSGDQLRIAVQLVRTSDLRQIWSHSFDRDASDIFATQDEIAAQVLDALLGAEMLGIAGPRSARTSTEVHDLFLQGRELWQQRQAAAIRRSIELLSQAVDLDPEFLEARSELATALYLSPDLSRLEKIDLIEPELEAVFAVNPEDPQALAIHGLLLLDEGQMAAGRAGLRRALDIRPNDVNFLGWLAGSYEASGLIGMAARYNRRAFELDPMNLFARSRLMNVLLAERSPDALVLARQTVRLFPDEPLAWALLLRTYRTSSDDVGAVLAAVDALEHVAEPEYFVFEIAYGFNLLGDFELADRWRAVIPQYRPAVQREFHWRTARGDLVGFLEHVDGLMQRHGQTPELLAWHARALISVGAYEEAREVLTQIQENGAELSDPENVNWAQVETPILLAALAQREGDVERAEELERSLQPIIDITTADSPQGALEYAYFLAYARGRYEEAVSYRLQYAWEHMELLPMVRHIPFWADFESVAAGRAVIEDLERRRARDLERLRDVEIPWLMEPEQWLDGRRDVHDWPGRPSPRND